MMDKNTQILALLKQETGTAMGCTEPAAVALASAIAASKLTGKLQKIELFVSPNILKNGMGVGIPGTGMIGLEIASVLGAMIADPTKNLEILSDLDPGMVKVAKDFLNDGKHKTKLAESADKIWIEAIVYDNRNNQAKAIIRYRHDWLYRLELNGSVLEVNEIGQVETKKITSCANLTVKDYYDFCVSIPIQEIESINLGNLINREIARFGLEKASGIAVGKTLMGQIEAGILGDDLHHYAMALTAAATDARMSGCPLPVVSNSGSGNQGLSITLPIIAVAEKRGIAEERLIRSLCLGHLVSVHIKHKIGVLSCLCGCLSAAAGAACGIVFLLDGSYNQVEFSIKNMIGNTAGMVCDGAKEGCSLKVATNTSAAVQAALLALSNLCVSDNDGIITKNIEDTISNLAELVLSGMQNADSTILKIMINKNNKEV